MWRKLSITIYGDINNLYKKEKPLKLKFSSHYFKLYKIEVFTFMKFGIFFMNFSKPYNYQK